MQVFLTHSSTACVLLEIGSVRILTDPVLDPGQKHYPFAPFPLSLWIGATRMKPSALDPAALPPAAAPLDAVLLSHAHHTDNLDAAGKAMLRHAREIVTSAAGQRFLQPQLRATGLRPWQETTIFGREGERIRIIATPARHGPWWLPGVCDVVGFILQWDAGASLEKQEHGAIYLTGDTVWFRGIEEVIARAGAAESRVGNIGTLLPHLGAVHFSIPQIRYTFNGSEAARLAKELRVRQTIPIHYERDVWTHFREDFDSYEQAFRDAGVPSLQRLVPGQRTAIVV